MDTISNNIITATITIRIMFIILFLFLIVFPVPHKSFDLLDDSTLLLYHKKANDSSKTAPDMAISLIAQRAMFAQRE